jgi:NAD(P)-dependent dehydrogenase (short-subunit alcohol dehydrogenase family)
MLYPGEQNGRFRPEAMPLFGAEVNSDQQTKSFLPDLTFLGPRFLSCLRLPLERVYWQRWQFLASWEKWEVVSKAAQGSRGMKNQIKRRWFMKAIVIGTGTIGSAVKKALGEKGHEVVSVGRKSGDYQADISDTDSLKALFSKVGSFEAVACAAGDVFPAPLEQTTDGQWANSIEAKGMGQINLVRAALPFIADKGSFTLISGVLTDEYTAGGVIGTVINHMVEGFVKAAAVELPRGVRINCISPTVLTESVAYHPYFPGFIPVDAREVGQAYLRAISNPITGRILKLHKTDS